MTLPTLNADLIHCRDEAEWLSERRKRIQASEVSAVLGQSEWGSPLSVYMDKTAPPLLNATSERFTIGHELEQPIRNMYVRKFGGKLHNLPPYTIAASREHKFLGCTPDGLCEDASRSGVGLLEIKTASEFSRRDWQESIPLAYQIQVQASLAVLQLQWGVVAVLIGVGSIERYFVERNDKFIAAMLAAVEDFATCLELRTAPPVDGSEATAKALARLHPSDNGLATRLPGEFNRIVNRWQRVKSLIKRLDKAKGECDNQLKAALGENTFGVTESGQWVSWKSQTRKAYSVAESTSRVLRECKEPHRIEYADGSGETGIDYKVADRVQLPRRLKLKLLNQRGTCRHCGCRLTMATATWEHMVPLSVGGTNDESNLDLACRKCNEERGNDASLPVTVTQGAQHGIHRNCQS